MIEYVMKQALAEEEGIWFMDHNAFLVENVDPFFRQIDGAVSTAKTCLFTPDQVPMQT